MISFLSLISNFYSYNHVWKSLSRQTSGSHVIWNLSDSSEAFIYHAVVRKLVCICHAVIWQSSNTKSLKVQGISWQGGKVIHFDIYSKCIFIFFIFRWCLPSMIHNSKMSCSLGISTFRAMFKQLKVTNMKRGTYLL